MADTISVYKTRTMMTALKQMKKPKSFLLQKFFNLNRPKISGNYVLDIDIWKGKRKMAKFQDPNIAGETIDKINFNTETYRPAYIKPKITILPDDLQSREMQGVIYNDNVRPGQKQATIAGEGLANLRDMILRKMEWMAAQALQTGAIAVSGIGLEARDIDFNMDASHKVTLLLTARWSDADDCTPITNLRDWKRLCTKDSGISPDSCVMGFNAYTSFLASDEVKEYLDKRNIFLGNVAPRDEGEGVTYVGKIEQLDIYVYDEWYINDAGTEVPMIDVNACIMGSTRAQTSTNFAAIRDLKNKAITDFFPKYWETEDPSVGYLMLQSAPLPALSQADAFLTAVVQ